MREFIRGWKRKIGVVTLLMACLFMSWWIQSFGKFVGDFYFPYGGSLRSLDGRLSYRGYTTELLQNSHGKGINEVEYWSIPYWSIVPPLVVLSAYLLLTKPRAKKAG